MFNKNKKMNAMTGLESFDTLVGKTTEIQGRMTVHDSVRIDGRVFGNLEPADKYPCTIAIGPDGEIHGNIICNRAYVAGIVHGTIYAKDSVTLSASAVVKGDIHSESFHIETGAQIDGSMLQANRQLRSSLEDKPSAHNKNSRS